MFETNRSAGKTTSLHRYFLERALKCDEEFVMLYRKKQDLSNSAIQFSGAIEIFDSLSAIVSMEDKPCAGKCVRKYVATVQRGEGEQVEIEKIVLGYAISLYDADDVKKYSAMFSKVMRIGMEEFQIESGKYLKDETTKFQSVYYSISRGGGQQSRNVDVFLLSNSISLLNPYYLYYGVGKRLKPDTRKLRGNGWVLIREFNESAAVAVQNNIVNSSFKGTKYFEYASGQSQLIAVNSFIEKIEGNSKYLFTIFFDGRLYGVRILSKSKLMHISKKHDPSSIIRYVLCDSDIKDGYFLLRKNSDVWKSMRNFYDNNKIRFEDEECKNLIFDILGIDILN